jgi:hypothetical protein
VYKIAGAQRFPAIQASDVAETTCFGGVFNFASMIATIGTIPTRLVCSVHDTTTQQQQASQ